MQERFPLFFHAACFPFLFHLKQQHFTKQKLLPRIWIQYWKKSGYLHFFLFTFHVIALLFYFLFATKIWRTWLNCFGCSFSNEPNEIVSGTTSISSNLIPNNNDPRKTVVSIEIYLPLIFKPFLPYIGCSNPQNPERGDSNENGRPPSLFKTNVVLSLYSYFASLEVVVRISICVFRFRAYLYFLFLWGNPLKIALPFRIFLKMYASVFFFLTGFSVQRCECTTSISPIFVQKYWNQFMARKGNYADLKSGYICGYVRL